MKAFELLAQTPSSIKTLKKSIVPLNVLKHQFPFKLNSDEEKKFYETLVINEDTSLLLWYENHAKAFKLFVAPNEDKKIDYYMQVLNVLGELNVKTKDYDGGDPELLGEMSFEEAVEIFLQFIQDY